MENVTFTVLDYVVSCSKILIARLRVVGKSHTLPSTFSQVWSWNGKHSVECINRELRVCRHLNLPDSTHDTVEYATVTNYIPPTTVGAPMKGYVTRYFFNVKTFSASLILGPNRSYDEDRLREHLKNAFNDTSKTDKSYPATWWDAVKIQVFRRPGIGVQWTLWQKLTYGRVISVARTVVYYKECYHSDPTLGDCIEFLNGSGSGTEDGVSDRTKSV